MGVSTRYLCHLGNKILNSLELKTVMMKILIFIISPYHDPILVVQFGNLKEYYECEILD